MNQLEVKTRKLQLILTILLGLFFVPFGLLGLINGLLIIGGLAKGEAPVSLVFGFVFLGFYGVIMLVARIRHAGSVKYFSDEGLVRNDGRSFAWADLSHIVNQYRNVRGTKGLWRVEIRFRNGEAASVIPEKISNFREVGALVDNLPCEHTEKIVW